MRVCVSVCVYDCVHHTECRREEVKPDHQQKRQEREEPQAPRKVVVMVTTLRSCHGDHPKQLSGLLQQFSPESKPNRIARLVQSRKRLRGIF